MEKQKEIKIIPFGPGEAHLQHEIISPNCHICGEDKDREDMVLMHIDGKKLGFVCTHHKGAIQAFIQQYGRLPLGWTKVESEE